MIEIFLVCALWDGAGTNAGSLWTGGGGGCGSVSVLQKVASEDDLKVRNHGEGPY